MREAKRENTRCGLRPTSDKAASQKTRSPEGCDENGPATALLLSHVSIEICSFVPPVRLGPPCRRPFSSQRCHTSHELGALACIDHNEAEEPSFNLGRDGFRLRQGFGGHVQAVPFFSCSTHRERI